MQTIMYNDIYRLTKAVIEGRKPLTRRGIDPQPVTARHWNPEIHGTSDLYCRDERGLCQLLDENGKVINPRYKVGEIVAVAQRYADIDDFDIALMYSGTAAWNNKMFVKAELMPHQQKCISVRAERLQDISDDDCLKEGIIYLEEFGKYYFGSKARGFYFDSAREAFASLIDKVGKKGDWESNPFVWRYEFELLK